MSEARKTNPYSAAILGPLAAMQATGFAFFCDERIKSHEAGWAVYDAVGTCLCLAATIYYVRIVWLELRKSDPHYQKQA